MPLFLHSENAGPARSVPLRAEVRPEDTWDLTPLYATDAAWEEDFQKLQAGYPKIAGFRGRVGENVQTLLEVLELEKSLEMRIEQLNQFASLRVTEDSSDSTALTREARLESLLVLVGETFSFVSPEIQAIPDGLFEAFLNDPLLSDWIIPLKSSAA